MKPGLERLISKIAMSKIVVIPLLICIFVTADSRLLLPRELIERSEDKKEGDTKGFSEASNKDPFHPIGHDPTHN